MHCWWKDKKYSAAILETALEFYKVKRTLTQWLNNINPEYLLKWHEKQCSYTDLYTNVYSGLIHSHKRLGTIQMSLNLGMRNQTGNPQNGKHWNRKEWSTGTGNKADWPQNHSFHEGRLKNATHSITAFIWHSEKDKTIETQSSSVIDRDCQWGKGLPTKG